VTRAVFSFKYCTCTQCTACTVLITRYQHTFEKKKKKRSERGPFLEVPYLIHQFYMDRGGDFLLNTLRRYRYSTIQHLIIGVFDQLHVPIHFPLVIAVTRRKKAKRLDSPNLEI